MFNSPVCEAGPSLNATGSTPARKARKTYRTMVACIACKQKKQKCDGQAPACRNCIRAKRVCMVEDPTTRRRQPRAYVRSLEERCALLEQLLRADHPELAGGNIDGNADMDDVSEEPLADNGCSHYAAVADSSTSLGTGGQLKMIAVPDAVVPAPTVEVECDNPNDLSSEVGLLCLNAAGREAPYIGPSSAFSFSRVLSSGLRGLSSSRSEQDLDRNNTNDHVHGPRATCPPEPLPSRSVGSMLSKVYFANINPQYPFLHQPTFAKWEDELMTAHEAGDLSQLDPAISYFVFMIYAVAALVIPGNLESSAEGYYISAQQYLDYMMHLDNIETIQAILCCAMFSIRSACGASIWSLSGIALRQCVKLGYHRSLRRTKLDPLKTELAKRCFWVSYDMDRAAGVTLGRPFCLADKDIDVEFPLDVDDDSITVSGIFGAPRTLNEPSTSVSCAIHIYKMRQTWSRIHETMYSNRACEPIDFPFVESTHKELDTWYKATPEELRTGPGGQLSVFSSKEWFSIAYHHTLLLIYRRHLIAPSCDLALQRAGNDTAGNQDAIASAFTICSNSGRQICLLYRHLYISRSVSYTWGSLHMLLLGGLTYLHTLWSSSDIRQATRQDDVCTTCTACTMVLVIMAERWKAAAAYRDIFDTLASRTITMICDTERASRPIPRSSTQRQPWAAWHSATGQASEKPPLQEWVENVADIGMCEGLHSMLDIFLAEREIQGSQS